MKMINCARERDEFFLSSATGERCFVLSFKDRQGSRGSLSSFIAVRLCDSARFALITILRMHCCCRPDGRVHLFIKGQAGMRMQRGGRVKKLRHFKCSTC
jgi:hypothetical protein